jgi:hypothetical protein
LNGKAYKVENGLVALHAAYGDSVIEVAKLLVKELKQYGDEVSGVILAVNWADDGINGTISIS